jgi:small subunit ribosomal protein S17
MAKDKDLEKETDAPELEAETPEVEAPAEQPDETPGAAATSADASADAAAEAAPKRKPRARKRAAKASKVLTPEERRAERDADRRRKAIARRAGRVAARAKYRAAEHERQATPPREHVPGKQKTRQGIVVSDRADKTITVRIDIARRHRRYEKIVRTSSTVHAHDDRNEAQIGDTVVVRECRPLSRTKRWRLIQVVEKAK